ncbi:DUF2336 domain-containing protein [Undibacter mobilis]|uniref:DUF2336 domain-containing protein n=1 Tax=Undibacter mobilis TaxID=2292256 RepID=A0A371B3R8_9BRAD|nr:DUF2336 domain-containing protein [Undibacter mobilis]RDV02174.1 DUF2336 domain-containing protein [Undibacter mobilis]
MIKPPSISPIDGLVDLACRDGVDVRPTLLRVLTDLYVQKPVHSADETTQYVELALGLIDTVDSATKAAVAASLSHYPAAPTAVLAKLGLADNAPAAHAPLPEIAFVPETAAPPLVPAPEPVAAEPVAIGTLTDVFFDAPAADRRLILANLDIVADPAALVSPASNDTAERLEQAAFKREPATFARVIENALGVNRDLAHRITEDSSGEPIVIMARALGIKAAVLQRILLFLNPAIGRSVERVFDLAMLHDEISLATACHMVTLWRHDAPAAQAQQKARHEPVYQEDARTVRRPSGRENRRTDTRESTMPYKATR